MSPHCVWLVIVGGYEVFVGGGIKKPVNVAIADTNRQIMIIELGNLMVCSIYSMCVREF